MKRTFAFSLLILACAVAFASAGEQTPITVAVYDFAGGKDAKGYGSKVTALVTADLAAETNIVTLERADLDKALNEQAFGISGMVNPDAAAKIGKITGAKVLIAGQVMQSADNHLILVADIISTETGRLFAEQAEGSANSLVQLTSNLSRRIAQTISDRSPALIATNKQSNAEQLEQIIKHIPGTNRPAISINIKYLRPDFSGSSFTCEEELGHILLKAGFPVVDENSDQKPEVVITGVARFNLGTPRRELFESGGVLQLKAVERRTGRIIANDTQEGAGIGGKKEANRMAQINAVDELAGQLLPLLAQ